MVAQPRFREYRCIGSARRMPGTDRDGGVRGSQTLGRTHISSPNLSLAPVRTRIDLSQGAKAEIQ
jgi:hypothetical protein